MNKILPWILTLIFAATTGFLFFDREKQKVQMAALNSQVLEIDGLRTKLEAAEKTTIDHNELERLRKDNEEVYKLRNQVAQLQKKLREMPQVPVATFEPAPTQPDPTLTAQPVDPVNDLQRQQAEQCVENLKIVEEAKTMWAVANNKQAGDKVTLTDITTALPNNTMPLCPAGGTYDLQQVGIPASCSIPGHSLLP